jgi:stage II sporulation protein D
MVSCRGRCNASPLRHSERRLTALAWSARCRKDAEVPRILAGIGALSGALLHLTVRIVLASLLIATPAFAIDNVAVRLFTSQRPLRSLEFRSPIMLQTNQRESFITPPATLQVHGNTILLLPSGSTTNQGMTFQACTIRSSSSAPIRVNLSRGFTREYDGTIKVSLSSNSTLEVINVVPTERYVTSVVASETPLGSPAEMLKAQAVLVQTLLSRRAEHKTIDDSTATQIYQGHIAGRPEVAAAVQSVWGERLLYHGAPIQVFYHSTCAGGTSSAANFFHLPGGSLPYLAHITCNYCSASPFYRKKQADIPAEAISELCGGALPVVLATDEANRPLKIAIAQNKIVSGYDFWIRLGQKIGWDKVPGTRYVFSNANPGPLSARGKFTITSSGGGHGIGMCQWGAIGMAKAGKKYNEILQYYFPGCNLVHSYSGNGGGSGSLG